MGDFADGLIAAHQAGLQERRRREDFAKQQEERDIQKQILKHQIDRLKIDDALHEREAAGKQFEFLQSIPGQSVPDTSPGNELPAVGDQPAVPLGGTQVLPHATVNFAAVPGMNGSPGVPGFSAQPKTLQEVLHAQRLSQIAASQQKQQDAAAAPYTLAEGAQRITPSLTGGEPTIVTNEKPVPKPTEGDITRGLSSAFYRYQHKIPDGQKLTQLDQALADSEYEAFKTKAKKNSEDSADQSAVTLTPAALDVAARRYLADGTLPAMGNSKASGGARSRIINRAAVIDPQAAIAVNKAVYDSTKASLTQITKNIAAVNAFESTALKNLDLFISTASKVADSGSPWINKGLRSVNRSLLGKPEQTAYDAARQVALTEIARVVSNPSLAGVLSDSARHEMEAILGGDATLKQTLAAAQLLRQDMANRKTSLNDEQSILTGQLKAIGTPQPATTPESGDWKVLGVK